MRLAWFATLSFSVLLTLAGTVFALRDTYHYGLPFERAGLTAQFEGDGSITVQSMNGAEGLDFVIPPMSRIVSVDGRAVLADTRYWILSDRLDRPLGLQVSFTIKDPGGKVARHVVSTSESYRESIDDDAPIGRDVRFSIRLATSLLTCLALISCGVLLFVRRPHDPVALLFSFSFLLFAGVIDPALQLWIVLGLGTVLDCLAALAWIPLVLGIATFPDGRFVPRILKMLILAAPALAIVQVPDSIPLWLSALVAYVLPVGLLLSQAIRFRKYEPGIERQQIKWAAYGFGIGMLLVAAAFIIFPLISPLDPSFPLWGLGIVLLFNLGFVSIAAGLLVSLIRFRLWEADRVISRSAIAAIVTLAVGILWTLGMDVVKTLVERAFGRDSELVATMTGALLAAGIFAPTQAIAQKWATRRLGKELTLIRKLIERLAIWRTSETPDEIAQRALSAIAGATHAGSSAILIDTPRGQALLASRDIADPEALVAAGQHPETDGRFPIALPLEDEDGPVGWLLAGTRSDRNRYNAHEMEGFRLVTEPLAEALRAARKRSQESEKLLQMLGTVEERLARLEDPAPPRPA
ncbi:hypothetical protein GRI89_17160 [Altererythrobacter salegens]|uniref:GAF domain-containing protein n=1 Tax=Croceibacterium salegens TaxID=1737568 RepID=A0A6I4T1V5_9SPHN|nr:hypothetical protein [Croceibacterium salegens]MXO61276.1 hypothetical protein [Croceibacterium salegens]